MAKASYMALDDFQTLWDDALKPVLAMKSELGGFLSDITQEEFNSIFD